MLPREIVVEGFEKPPSERTHTQMSFSIRINTARQVLQGIIRRKRKGFTLIELLVVVVIIGILASIALPSFIGAQDKARNSAVQSNVNTVRLGLEQYATDHNGVYPIATALFSGMSAGNYLPGNKFPRSPWCTTSQSTGYTTASPEILALSVASGTNLPALPATAINAAGVVADPPTVINDYGSVQYDQDPGSQTYVIYGTGKNNKASIVSAAQSNNGQ